MPQKAAIGTTVAFALMVAAFSARSVARAGLLDEHFGVTLQLDTDQYDHHQNALTYPFELSSFVPTNNVDTVDYIVGDWYGAWSRKRFKDKIMGEDYPTSSEPYDVEAMYFDDDPLNLYMALVTSFPGPPGYNQTQLSGLPLFSAGDLAIDLGLNPEHTRDNFSYDYGVNINYERRLSRGDAKSGGFTIGNGVYRTSNSDWYLGSPRHPSAAGGELTNFDPNYVGFSGEYLGDALVEIYGYEFEDAMIEGGHPAYVIEATIPRGLLTELYEGDEVGLSWAEGCRNEGNGHDSIMRFRDLPDIDYNQEPTSHPVPEPSTLMLLGLCAALAFISRRRR